MSEEIDHLQYLLSNATNPSSLNSTQISNQKRNDPEKDTEKDGVAKTQLETMGYTFGNEKFNDAQSNDTPGF